MPRKAKGPRIYIRRRKGREAVVVIRDGEHEESTGCSEGDREGIDLALERYLARTRLARTRQGDPNEILIVDVLSYYATHKAPKLHAPQLVGYLSLPLIEYAGDDAVSAIDAPWCREYANKRTAGKLGRKVQEQTARRELEHLGAALRFAVKDNKLAAAPHITLPEKGESRERFLTRSEAARLIWAAWRHREVQHGHPTARHTLRHIARFILIGIYTGTRTATILSGSFKIGQGRSYIDTARGIYYRLPEGRRQSNKRRPTMDIPDRLLMHLRRWEAIGMASPVEFNGQPVDSIKRGFAKACAIAKIEDATPHVLRHTFMTWFVPKLGLEGACKRSGMSLNTARRVYWHLDPESQETRDFAYNRGISGASAPATRSLNRATGA